VKSILFLTVGGSHQPILRSLEQRKPDRTVFVCSGRDPATGAKGSREQIEGNGSVIGSERGKAPDLPNIPTQAGLVEDAYEVLEVRADNLDDIYAKVAARVAELRAANPGAAFSADYTGGTKSMSAGLVAAALDAGVALLAVIGARDNLERVVDGTEDTTGMSVERIRFERDLAPAKATWDRYAYDEAEKLVGAIPSPNDETLRVRRHLGRDLSRALAAWDRFDHAGALRVLKIYRQRIGKRFGLHLKALESIGGKDENKSEALKINDLWLNAQRRAAQGRYDDAVARLYRMLEWTAQWQLRLHCGVETSNIPAEKVPEGIELQPNREGKLQAGLFQAWRMIGLLPGNVAAGFAREQANAMLDHLQRRNGSILAHGFTPIAETDWIGMANWVGKSFRPMFTELARNDAGLRFDLDAIQLPREFPD